MRAILFRNAHRIVNPKTSRVYIFSRLSHCCVPHKRCLRLSCEHKQTSGVRSDVHMVVPAAVCRSLEYCATLSFVAHKSLCTQHGIVYSQICPDKNRCAGNKLSWQTRSPCFSLSGPFRRNRSRGQRILYMFYVATKNTTFVCALCADEQTSCRVHARVCRNTRLTESVDGYLRTSKPASTHLKCSKLACACARISLVASYARAIAVVVTRHQKPNGKTNTHI